MKTLKIKPKATIEFNSEGGVLELTSRYLVRWTLINSAEIPIRTGFLNLGSVILPRISRESTISIENLEIVSIEVFVAEID